MAAPISVQPMGDGAAAVTGLAAWRDYNAALLSRKIERSGPAGALANVRKPQVVLPFDVWTRVEVADLSATPDQSLHISAGADYHFAKAATVGISAMRIEPDDSQPQDTLSAYANFKLSSALSLGAKGHWSPTTTPPLADGDASKPSSEKITMLVGPRLSQTYRLDGSQTIEPYLTLQSEFHSEDLSVGNMTTPSAGGGITFAKPQSYSLSISTMIETLEATNGANVSSRLQLKLPID